jgi:hypothetical protein
VKLARWGEVIAITGPFELGGVEGATVGSELLFVEATVGRVATGAPLVVGAIAVVREVVAAGVAAVLALPPCDPLPPPELQPTPAAVARSAASGQRSERAMGPTPSISERVVPDNLRSTQVNFALTGGRRTKSLPKAGAPSPPRHVDGSHDGQGLPT